MKTADFDPVAYKAAQRRMWGGVAAGWEKWWPTIERTMGAVTERIAERAQVRPGHTVLDVATGIGEPALTVAPRVRPGGKVVATDQAPEMLDIARRRAAAAAAENVEFLEADAERLAFPSGAFDAVVCRFGLMFLPDVGRFLRRVHALLVPGGRFVTAVWDQPEHSPPDDLGVAIAMSMFGLPGPPPGAPTFYGLAGGVLEGEMARAGFRRIRAERVPADFEWPSIEICQQYLRDVIPFFATVAEQPPDRQAEFWRVHAAAARKFAGPDGTIRSRSTAICIVGVT